jgi:hypothetical protein
MIYDTCSFLPPLCCNHNKAVGLLLNNAVQPFHKKVSASIPPSDVTEYWWWIFLDQQELVNILYILYHLQEINAIYLVFVYICWIKDVLLCILRENGEVNIFLKKLLISSFTVFHYFNIFHWNYRYKLIKEVGDGTFGSVWRAISKQTGEVVSMLNWYVQVVFYLKSQFCPNQLQNCRLQSRKWRRNITLGRSV